MHSRINNETINHIIKIPQNVFVEIEENLCIFKGPHGTILHKINKLISIKKNENTITLQTTIKKVDKRLKKNALINTTYALFKNYINGVLNLFEKSLIIKGVGYKAEYKDLILTLFLGYSHTINYKIPSDIKIEIITPTNILIKGVSKHKVGQIAHEIKMKKPADAYKGNGIKYKDDTTKLKSPKKTK